MNTSTIALTGATGFVGRHLTAELLDAGHTVLALHRRASTDGLPRHERLRWASLTQAADIFVGRGPDAVVHLATCYGLNEPLAEVMDSNVVMPLQLLKLAASAGCALFVSTDSYYAKPEFDYPYMRPYIDSKRAFIQCAGHVAQRHPSLKIVNVRLEHVFGPDDGPAKFVTHVLTKLLANQSLALTPGEQRRDFIHVDDVVSAYLTLLAGADRFAVGVTEVQIGTGEANSIRNFVETARSLSGSTAPLDFGAVPYREREIMSSVADTTTLDQLGFTPRYKMASGIQATVDAMRYAPSTGGAPGAGKRS